MALDRLRVRTNIILLFPEFIQLLIGLMLIVNKSLTYYPYCSTSAAALSLYIMTQCQLKLHLSRRSLAETLSYAEVAPRNDEEMFKLDQLLLKFINHTIHKQLWGTEASTQRLRGHAGFSTNDRGDFRHVQPNPDPTKRGPPQARECLTAEPQLLACMASLWRVAVNSIQSNFDKVIIFV